MRQEETQRPRMGIDAPPLSVEDALRVLNYLLGTAWLNRYSHHEAPDAIRTAVYHLAGIATHAPTPGAQPVSGADELRAPGALRDLAYALRSEYDVGDSEFGQQQNDAPESLAKIIVDLEEIARPTPATERPGVGEGSTGVADPLADLVQRFGAALLAKLRDAEAKYGYSSDWMRPGWMDTARAELVRHVAKGDPRDVAAYCAFLWHHGESTAGAAGALDLGDAMEERMRAMLAQTDEHGWSCPEPAEQGACDCWRSVFVALLEMPDAEERELANNPAFCSNCLHPVWDCAVCPNCQTPVVPTRTEEADHV